MAVMRARKGPRDLRSYRWFGPDDMRSFGHRSRAKQAGFSSEDISGKPVIAILNTWSDANPCHTHFRIRAEEVKRGIWQAGGFPMEIPVLTLGETFMKPSTLLYRNLLAMDAEEALRAYPADGVVLMAGCDKTVPALVMGATSANLPALLVPAGPMLRGNWRGQFLGSGSDLWKYWSERRAGTLDECSWGEMEDGIARSYGTCMTMGTASTMAAAVEALGLTLPGASSIPAADSAHARMAVASGRRSVEMVWENLTPREILTTKAFENAVTAAMALGGSTNAIIHLIAMAGRAGADLDLDRFENARVVEAHPRFVAVSVDHQLERLAQIGAAVVERFAVGNGAGDLFHPPDVPTVGLGSDNRVVALDHGRRILPVFSNESQPFLPHGSNMVYAELALREKRESRPML